MDQSEFMTCDWLLQDQFDIIDLLDTLPLIIAHQNCRIIQFTRECFVARFVLGQCSTIVRLHALVISSLGIAQNHTSPILR